MTFKFFEKKRVLITGGNGYIAYNLIKKLSGVNLNVTRLDLRIDRWPEFDNSDITIQDVEGDIRDRKLIDSLLPGHDVIFHLAAQTSSYVADSDPARDIFINVLPLINILDICYTKSLNPVIVLAGTATEVGLTEMLPVNEETEDHPETIYDLHKLFAEKYLKYYSDKGIVSGTILRLANVYGPGPVSSSQDRGIINHMIKKAVNKLPLTLYDDGKFTRDFIFIDDVASAFLNAAINIDKLKGEHYYIGSGKGLTIVEMFKTISERTQLKLNYPAQIIRVDSPSNLSVIEKRNFIADISRFSNLTGWSPETDHITGIDLTIDHFLKQ
jgi:nucleoside-diphosphate-sugar epimerase